MRATFLCGLSLFLLIAPFLLWSCYTPVPTETEPFTRGIFEVDSSKTFLHVEPYINAMPGAVSNDVIIPIYINFEKAEDREKWPRKFYLIKAKVFLGSKIIYQGNGFDHNKWMNNSIDEPFRNGLRIPIDQMPPVFSMTVWFKDSTGKKYKSTFRDLGAGNVY